MREASRPDVHACAGEGSNWARAQSRGGDHFGKRGPYYYWIARGVDERPVRADRIRKSLGAENTFSADIFTFEAACEVLQPIIEWTSGTLRWTIVGIGKETASIGFEARLGEEEGHVRLHWTSANRWSGEKRQCENRIELTTRAQPLGGRR